MRKEVRDMRLAQTVLGSARNNNDAAKRLRFLGRQLYQVELGSARPGKIFWIPRYKNQLLGSVIKIAGFQRCGGIKAFDAAQVAASNCSLWEIFKPVCPAYL